MDNKTIRHFGKNTLNEFLEELKERVVDKIHNIETIMPKKLSDLENDLEMATSWDDLKDKPFYEEVIFGEEEVIIDNQVLDFSIPCDMIVEGYAIETDLADIMTLDKDTEYTVIIDGVEYISKPKYNSDFEEYCLGNPKYMFGDDNGEPFVFRGMGTQMGQYDLGFGMVTPGTRTVTIKAKKVQEKVKPLDEKFIPDSMKPLVINGILTAVDERPILTIHEMVLYNDVKEALLLGRRVVLIVDDINEGCTQILPANSIFDSFIDFNNMFAGYAIQLKNNDAWGII